MTKIYIISTVKSEEPFCLRGKGKVMAGKRLYEMNFINTIYISPNTPHQLRNPFTSPFGFLCIVNAKRDKPKIIQ